MEYFNDFIFMFAQKKITIKIRAHQIKRHKNANNDFDQSVVLEIKKKKMRKKTSEWKE